MVGESEAEAEERNVGWDSQIKRSIRLFTVFRTLGGMERNWRG